MHWVICSALPLKVTARSVELGSISLATWMEQPVVWRISLIFEPLLPARMVAPRGGDCSENGLLVNLKRQWMQAYFSNKNTYDINDNVVF